jgi:hypothetical protein
MRKLLPALFLFCFALAGCSYAHERIDRPLNETAESQNDPPLIENEDVTPALRGIDADGNGIRDDVDRLIAKKYSATPVVKKVAELQARALQQLMDSTTCEEATAAGEQIFRAHNCAYKYLPHANEEDREIPKKMFTEIESLTANTKERLIAYFKAEWISTSKMSRSNKNPVCD